MPTSELKGAFPTELLGELEAGLQARENKYAFQVGLKDLDFEIDEEKRKARGETTLSAVSLRLKMPCVPALSNPAYWSNMMAPTTRYWLLRRNR